MTLPKGVCLLQDYLDKHNMSQSELSRRSGVSQRSISDYVRNKKQMSVDAAKAISKVFGVTIEDLYRW